MDFGRLLQQLHAGDTSLETVRSWMEDSLEEKTLPPAVMLEMLDSAVREGLTEDTANELRQIIENAETATPKEDAFVDFDIGDLSLASDEPTVRKTDDGSSKDDDDTESPACHR